MLYYRKHLGDYFRDTRTLSVYEHGVYNLLLDHYYSEEKPISTYDAYAIIRPAGSAQKQAVQRVLQRYFEPASEGTAWRHHGADRVIAESKESIERNREHATKRWRKAAPLAAAIDAITTAPAAASKPRKPAAAARKAVTATSMPAACHGNADADADVHADSMPYQEPITNIQKPKSEREAAAPAPPPHARAREAEISSISVEDQPQQRQRGGQGSQDTRLPPGWTLPKDWAQEVVQLRQDSGLEPIDVKLEGIKFADYWHAATGDKAVKRDWHAAWRYWALKGYGATASSSPSSAPRAGSSNGGDAGSARKPAGNAAAAADATAAWQQVRAAFGRGQRPKDGWTHPQTEGAIKTLGGFHPLMGKDTWVLDKMYPEFQRVFGEMATG